MPLKSRAVYRQCTMDEESGRGYTHQHRRSLQSNARVLLFRDQRSVPSQPMSYAAIRLFPDHSICLWGFYSAVQGFRVWTEFSVRSSPLRKESDGMNHDSPRPFPAGNTLLYPAQTGCSSLLLLRTACSISSHKATSYRLDSGYCLYHQSFWESYGFHPQGYSLPAIRLRGSFSRPSFLLWYPDINASGSRGLL